jgi:hypothetical protein
MTVVAAVIKYFTFVCADDVFASAFTSVVDDVNEMMDCSERDDNNTEATEATEKPIVMEPASDNIEMQTEPSVTSSAVPTVDDEQVAPEPNQWQPTDLNGDHDNKDPEVEQCKEKDDNDVTSAPSPHQSNDNHDGKMQELSTKSDAVVQEVEQKTNGEQPVNDTSTSLLSHLSDDLTDESTDETRGESACETSVAE